MEGTFWYTFSTMPGWVTIFWAVILTGSYFILRLLMLTMTVCICRMKRVRVSDGRPWDRPLFEETENDDQRPALITAIARCCTDGK